MKDKKKKEKKKVITKKLCRKIRREDGLTIKTLTSYTFRAFLEAIESRYHKRVMYKVFRKEGEMRYGEFAHHVRATSSYFLEVGYHRGDRIAIMAESSPEWMVAYVAATSIGLTAIPILPDFTAKDAENILKDSEARAIFLNENQYRKISSVLKDIDIDIYRLEDMFEIEYVEPTEYSKAKGRKTTDHRIEQKKLDENIPLEDDIASIIYTSGTTGSSKGVMLTHMNLLRCADFNTDQYFNVKPGMQVLSILPMSHVYEFTMGQVLLLLCGCEITFLGKPPAVSILLPALKEVRPVGMFSVPLLMEKIYKAAVLPVLRDNQKVAKLNENPIFSWFIHRVICKKIQATFGGRLKVFGVGGAPLDPEVERFLYKGSFPYLIGYGLTETSPLIAGCSPRKKDHKPGFIGKPVKDCDLRIDEPDENGIGEVIVKGPNIMKGYYNNEELNREVFTEDGFFRTGDLGYIDPKSKMLALKGRKKTMILGPSGENIYPEGIENLINAEEFVTESLVVPEDGGLLALVKIDVELMAKKMKISVDDAKQLAKERVAEIRKKVNKELSSFSKLQKAELQEEDFERTPTMKIKRFLYPKKNKEKENKD